MNEADTELMRGKFAEIGFGTARCLEEADTAVINTCTVRQKAEDKAVSEIGRLKSWKNRNSDRVLIITGCAAQRLGYKKIKSRFPFVDKVIGAKNIASFGELIKDFYAVKYAAGDPELDIIPTGKSPVSEYITVMRGCSHRCSYCIVPSVRGPAEFIPAAEIIKEAEGKIAAGASELVLLGQTVNAYRTPEATFTQLLGKLLEIKELKRLRFMSPHPLYFDEDFTGLLRDNTRLARHIHLPVQSGSDRILKLMRRGYTREKYLRLLDKLRAAAPGLTVSTDFIVGYPGETREEFEESVSLVKEADFSLAFCFKYSPRTDRPEMAPDISREEMEDRLAELLEAVKKNSSLVLHQRIGKIEEVLFETENRGRTSTDFTVKVAETVSSGTLRQAEITDSDKNTLIGKVL